MASLRPPGRKDVIANPAAEACRLLFGEAHVELALSVSVGASTDAKA